MTTRFTHAQRNGKRKRPKQREKQGMGIDSLERLQIHRELQFLRNPNRERWAKLRQVKR